MSNMKTICFLVTLFAGFTQISTGNEYSANDENFTVEFISQQMIALNGKEFYPNILMPDKAYHDFVNYVIGGNKLTSTYYEKLIRIFKVVENKLKLTK